MFILEKKNYCNKHSNFNNNNLDEDELNYNEFDFFLRRKKGKEKLNWLMY